MREPEYPAWLQRHVVEHRDFIENLRPFPFEQPTDISGYYSCHQNDYLRLANHPEVVAARQRANEKPRIETFSSSVFGGASSEHDDFVELLKRSLRAGDVLLTTAGWTANVGLIDALVTEATPIYVDLEAHASIGDGIRLAHGRAVVVKHNDYNNLEKRVRVHGPGLVCIDALYSTDGSIPALDKYVDICRRYHCVLLLDEAHSFGMFGDGGGGLAVQMGLADQVHFRTVSLSKALGGHGGLVAGSADMVRSLKTRMRPVLFSSATSSVLAAGHRVALEILMREPERAARCLELAAQFNRALVARGVDTHGSASQIVSIFFDGERACELYGHLRELRILTSVFIYPAVPRGTSLVRFSLYAGLTRDDVRYLADSTLAALGRMKLLERVAWSS